MPGVAAEQPPPFLRCMPPGAAASVPRWGPAPSIVMHERVQDDAQLGLVSKHASDAAESLSAPPVLDVTSETILGADEGAVDRKAEPVRLFVEWERPK